MVKEAAIRPPTHEVIATPYDADCQDALTSHVDELITRAETAGWDRVRVASALMYLGAKRLTSAS
ncbi:hypothetical protein FJV83_29190 [Mesorhizobium sp. WSM4307]|nr:hypothetical protein CK232_34735 [Mesorhizobium sp. WSM4304]PBB70861.1 hypothetical protein CK227_35225 [Mesorhizobium sp. WSM4308]TRC73923.1 hypothetical protein FJV80_30115 [Mesorhizobium sp. WSM4310]TRC78142.1 hypothetical protein FJV81_11435 [Mesorhizobium sp. WSM4315]TRC79331.1 hypothetical protein FJV83_29190 [Mesorhizobium sp. WSM4307]